MPMNLSDIFGQSNAVATLTRAYQADRLPHGMIFAGPNGVGKGSTAQALATLFLCEHPDRQTAQACGHCQSCRLIAAGTHPDFTIIYKELIRVYDRGGKSKGTTLSINVIRPELIAKAAMKPSMNIGRVFLVEQAELMEGPAQNAMLKTLEEPAGRTLIILLTDSPDALLSTIRSRCQLIRFGPLDQPTVARELAKRQIDPATAADAARLARGSLGLALRWIDEGVIAPALELGKRIEALLATGQGVDELPSWLKKSAEAYADQQLQRDPLTSKDQATRDGLVLNLTLAADRIRQMLRTTDAPADCCGAIEAIVQAESYLDANVNTALILQQLALNLSPK